jgi:DUF4097 and DUF4098 domain-containing protein YvlB
MWGFKKIMFVSMAILSLMILVGGCSGPVVSEQFSEAYQVRSGTIIEIYNQSGNVSITGWDQSTVEITALKESHEGQEVLDKVDIIIDIAEKMIIRSLHLEEDLPVVVNFDLKVPEDVLIGMIEGLNGNITIEGVTGNPQITTSNGTVNVNGVNGIVSALSSNGNITVTGVKSLGDLRTSNGNITAELPLLHENLELNTSNGSISLSLAAAMEADLEVRTSNGTISIGNLKVTVTAQEQTLLDGTMNGGGYKISISTSNGSIELSALK